MPDSSEATLARLTALLETLQRQVTSMERRLNAEFVTSRDLANLANAVTDLRTSVSAFTREIHDGLRTHQRDFSETLSGYITKEEFDPVKQLVYGLVGLLLTALVGALVTMVIHARSVG